MTDIQTLNMVIQRNFELRLLWPIVLLGLCLWGFLNLAGEMMEGDLHAVDEGLLSWFRTGGVGGAAWVPRWFPSCPRPGRRGWRRKSWRGSA